MLLITLTMALFYSSVRVSPDSETVSQHEQHQDPETEAAKWNSAIILILFHLFFDCVMSKCLQRKGLVQVSSLNK